MVSGRLQQYVRSQFDAEHVDDALLELMGMSETGERPASERVQAAAVIVARGDLDKLAAAANLARVDWRDLLVMGGLAYEDWGEQLDQILGTDE